MNAPDTLLDSLDKESPEDISAEVCESHSDEEGYSEQPDTAFTAGFSNAMYGSQEEKTDSESCESLDASLKWLDGWVEGSRLKDRLRDGNAG